MKKYLIFCAALLMVVNISFAQTTYGFKAGMNLSNYSGNDMDGKVKIGFHGGMLMHYYILPSLILQPELLYSQRGFKKTETIGNLSTEYKHTLHYAELPVYFKMNLGEEGLRFQPYLGPEFRYLMQANQTVSENDPEKIDNVNSFDFGLGMGIDVEINRNMLYGARFSMGLADVFEKPSIGSQPDAKNYSFLISMGFIY